MPEQNIPKFTYKELRSMFAANDAKRDGLMEVKESISITVCHWHKKDLPWSI